MFLRDGVAERRLNPYLPATVSTVAPRRIVGLACNRGLKGDYIPVSPLDAKRRVVSLLDMIRFIEKTTLLATASLTQIVECWEREMAKDAGRIINTNDGIRSWVLMMLKAVEEASENLRLTQSKKRIALLKSQTQYQPRTTGEFFADYQGLQREFLTELCEINFALIPQNKLQYFEQYDLFGEKVLIALEDIKAAGNCLAVDLYDASVFHLLRVVEIGLRELAKELKIKFPKTPLDYEGWKAVVKAIDDKLSAKMPKARGPKQSAALKFKHDLLADFKAFEVLRNEIMHGRSHHNEQEAIGLFIRVRDFMQRLANQVAPKESSERAKFHRDVKAAEKRRGIK
jgi:hypothetical protein